MFVTTQLLSQNILKTLYIQNAWHKATSEMTRDDYSSILTPRSLREEEGRRRQNRHRHLHRNDQGLRTRHSPSSAPSSERKRLNMRREMKSGISNLFKVHATHATHATHTAHTAHTTQSSTKVVAVVIRNRCTLLFVFIDPFGKISLEERVLDLFLGQSRPVLFLLILLADDGRERTGGKFLGRKLETRRGCKSQSSFSNRWVTDLGCNLSEEFKLEFIWFFWHSAGSTGVW